MDVDRCVLKEVVVSLVVVECFACVQVDVFGWETKEKDFGGPAATYKVFLLRGFEGCATPCTTLLGLNTAIS